jgi:cephalosporin hydroxylase
MSWPSDPGVPPDLAPRAPEATPPPARVTIDLEAGQVTVERPGESVSHPLGTAEAFAIVSRAWLRCAWDVKYPYTFTWLGRPVIQLPDDLLRLQEAVYQLQPDVIVETGVAHGGSLVFHASLCRLIGRGRVIGVDVVIRPANRDALQRHELAPYIVLIEGDSIDPLTVARVKAEIRPGDRVLVLLDSDHRRAHVRAELEAYSEVVSVGSYLVAADGFMSDLAKSPRGRPEWASDNPRTAVLDFLARHPEFRLEMPPRSFDESLGFPENVTYWTGGWLRRTR